MFAVVCLVLVLASPFPTDGEDGSYNSFSRLAYCRTETACLHEVGHALDQRAGWISQSAEFEEALKLYLVVELRRSPIDALPLCILEMTYRSDDAGAKREIYAYLYQQSLGQPAGVPESLRGFYDWQAAQQLLDRVTPDQRLYFFG